MAHFAEVDDNNVVIRVVVIPDDQEARGQLYLSRDLGLGGRWKQTSYNTRGGVHYDPSTHIPDGRPGFRKNYAGVGYTFDARRNAFIPPRPYPSWQLNEDTCLWEPPSLPPGDGYRWDEDTQTWIL